MRVIRGPSGHSFTMLLGIPGREHKLYFVKHELVAYAGPFGPRLFSNDNRTPASIRVSLTFMMDEAFIDFKRRADRRPTKVIPEFMASLYYELARETTLKRITT